MPMTREHRMIWKQGWLLFSLFAVALAAGLVGCSMNDDAVWPSGLPPVAVENELLGRLVPGTVEAGGGYLVGAAPDRLDGEDRDRRFARRAVQRARENPATAEQARAAPAADLNQDGFITTDELIAQAQIGLTEEQLRRRLEATGYVFELSPNQQDYLLAHGVDRTTVARLPRLNYLQKQRFQRQRLR